MLDLREPAARLALGLRGGIRRFLDVQVARATASFVRHTTPAEAVLAPSMAFLDDPQRWNLGAVPGQAAAGPQQHRECDGGWHLSGRAVSWIPIRQQSSSPMERKYLSEVLTGGLLDQQVVVIEVGRTAQGSKLTVGDGVCSVRPTAPRDRPRRPDRWPADAGRADDRSVPSTARADPARPYCEHPISDHERHFAVAPL